MNNLEKKIAEEIRAGRIRIKALGKTCGRIFRLEADDKTYLNLTLGGLIVSALSAIGLIVFKSLAASQDMIVDSFEVADDGFYLHGRCLNLEKACPKQDEVYTILEDHCYNLDFFENLNDCFSELLLNELHNLNPPVELQGFETNEIILKQLITWIYNDKPTPYLLMQKTGFQNMQLSFRSLFNIILADNMIINITKNSDFHSELDDFLVTNMDFNNFTINELLLLKNLDFLKRLSIAGI